MANGTGRAQTAGIKSNHQNSHLNQMYPNRRRYQSIADYIAMALDGMPETMALETLNSVTKIVIDAQLIVAKHRHAAHGATSQSTAGANNSKTSSSSAASNSVKPPCAHAKEDGLAEESLIVLSELTPVVGNSAATVIGVSAVVDPGVGVVQNVASVTAAGINELANQVNLGVVCADNGVGDNAMNVTRE